MKIALITYHNALNYGASLQAYATQDYIKNNISQNIVIINYNNQRRKYAYDIFAQAIDNLKKGNLKTFLKMLIGSIFFNLRRKNFLKFYNKNIIKTEKEYTRENELLDLNKEYDFFVVGSDQVWNYNSNGKDFSYLLSFVQNKKRTMSYASSFGISDLPIELKDKYREHLLNINFLSTRESLGAGIIKNITGRDAKVVLDPVFLLNKSEWEKLASISSNKKSIIFVYTNKKNQFEDMQKTLNLKFNNLKIHKISRHISVSDFLSSNIKVDYSIRPEKFLKNIISSEIVFTASFHCVALSIILEKNFIVYLSGDKGKDSRLISLLEISGLMNRIYTEDMTKEKIYENIDFTNVKSKIEPYIKSSKSFFNQIRGQE